MKKKTKPCPSKTSTVLSANTAQDSSSRTSKSFGDDGEPLFFVQPFLFHPIQANDLLLKSPTSKSSKIFLIYDYFQHEELLAIMNKHKNFDTRKPISQVPTSLEIEFDYSQKISYQSMYLFESPKKRSKRCRSTPKASPPKNSDPKPPPATTTDLPPLQLNKSTNRKKSIQRLSSLSQIYDRKEVDFSPSHSSEPVTPMSLRKSIILDQGWDEFTGNFLSFQTLLDFIFLQNFQGFSASLDLKSVAKLKKVLLVSYELVLTADELATELIRRFWSIEQGIRRGDQATIQDQISLLKFLEVWLKEKPEDFSRQQAITEKLQKFLINASLKASPSIRDQLQEVKKLVDRASIISQEDNLLVHANQTNVFLRYLRKIHKELNGLSLHHISDIFLVVPPLEIAKQFCIFEFGLVSKVKLHHMITTQKTQKDQLSNPYLKSGAHFNRFVLFLIFLIFKIEKKIVLISRLVSVASFLYELRNFQSFAAIMTALTHTFIYQEINKILKEADHETYSLKYDLEALLDKQNGYRSMKRAINQASFPMVPFVPLVAQDLLRVDGYHQSSQKDGEKRELQVNLDKLEMVFEAFENIHLTQFSGYDFPVIKVFQDFLEKFYRDILYLLSGSHDTGDIEDVLYEFLKAKK